MTTLPTEFRSYTQPVNRRGDASRRIGGICAPYLKPSRQLGSIIEIFETRAFAAGIGMGFPHVTANLEHNMAALLATTDSGTLGFSNTRSGLDFELSCPNTSWGDDTLELIDTGLISGSSIEMIVRADHFEHRGAGVPTRCLDEVQLRSVSPVSTPAYPDATTTRRSLDLASQSFARQFDADETEVRYDLENGNAARYFTRTDLQVAAPVTVPPTPLAVAQRSHAGAGDLELRRRRNELEAKKIQAEDGHRPDEPRPLGTRILEHRMRKSLWDQHVESRSYACYSLVPDDQKHDWDPRR